MPIGPITRRTTGALICAAAPALLSACAERPAPDPRSAILVSAEWLAGNIEDPDLVLLHVGDSGAYRAEHIPGAHFVTRDQVSRPASDDADALRIELPAPPALKETLDGIGITDESRIVLYWGGDEVSPTARILFTLQWAGLGDRVALLDGGLGAWKAAGHLVTDELPTVANGNVTLRPRPDLVVDAAWIQSHGSEIGYALIDGRNRAFFLGEREDRGKVGHIAGAGSLEWQGLVDDSLRFKSPEEVAQAFTAAGYVPGDTVVAYCHVGQYATVVIFLARTLGYEARLYDGSFQDWALRDLPVVVEPDAASRPDSQP